MDDFPGRYGGGGGTQHLIETISAFLLPLHTNWGLLTPTERRERPVSVRVHFYKSSF